LRESDRNATGNLAARNPEPRHVRDISARVCKGSATIMRNERNTVKTAGANLLDKVSNGRLLSKGVDLRTRGGRRFRHLVESHVAELGEVTESELGLIKQAVTLQMQAERMQEQIVRGEAVDADALIRISGISRRLLATIGAKAKANTPAGPTLADIVAAHDASEQEGDE
jgi:hypothetical protein